MSNIDDKSKAKKVKVIKKKDDVEEGDKIKEE